jgi:hypothetical protein
VIGHNLETYPFPIAYPARSLLVADDAADRLDKATHLVELTATTLAVLVLAWCQASSHSTGAVEQWERKLELPLTSIRLGLIKDCRATGTSYQASLEVLAGSAEPIPDRRLRPACAYDLTPFCIWRSCPACHRDELFYLHQCKKERNRYFSFSTGHELTVKGAATEPAPTRATTLRAEPLGSVRAAAAAGWRASWTDLAPRTRRIAARLVDLTLTVIIGAVGWALASLIGVGSGVSAAAIAVLLAIRYEPMTALTGGTPGKRLLRIYAISVWDCTALNRADTLRRALFADLQLLFPPIIVY